MVKITNLDLLDDDAIDGTETLPVVKGGKSWRARLADLAAPMVAAAIAARDAAQGFLANTQAIAATLPYPLYASTAAAQADTTLFAGHSYTVVSGGQILIYVKNSPTSSSQTGIIPTQTYVDRLKSRAAVPTLDYGAYGDGAHPVADQAGLAAAIAAAQASVQAPFGGSETIRTQISVVLEPGIYDAGGFTYAGLPINIRARVPHTVVIRIPDGQYFVTQTGNLGSVIMDGIIFSGGLGAYNSTGTAANSSWRVQFTNCDFRAYTECAIGNNGVDSPFLKVKDCNLFGGLPSGNQVIGICWGGYIDEMVVEDCCFGGNNYHIKIGPRLSGHVSITRFYTQGGNNVAISRTLADIWIVPNTTDSGDTNGGHGTFITYGKFGNELLNSAYPAPRILVANEDTTTGTRRQQYLPSTVDAGYVSGLHLTSNKFCHVSPWNAPVIRSYISNIRYWIGKDNVWVGGNNSYMIEFPNGRSIDYTNNNNLFEFNDTAGNAPLLFSNAAVGRLEDKSALWPGDVNAVQVNPVSDDPSLAAVGVAFSGYELGYGSGTTSVAAADPYGTTDYAAVTGLALIGFTDPYGGAGGMMHAEVSLSKAAANSLTYVMVDVFNYATSGAAVKKTVALPAYGSPAKVSFPVLLPPHASPGTWQFRVYGSNIVAGSADTFVLGDMIISKGGGRLGRDRALSARFPLASRNPRLLGGAAATLPTGWSMATNVNGLAGITATINRVGVDRYGHFVEIAFGGNCTAAGQVAILAEVAKALGLESGNAWRGLFGLRLMSGDWSAFTSSTAYDGTTGPVAISFPCYSSAGAWLIQRGMNVTPTTAYKAFGRTFTSGFFHASGDYMLPSIGFSFAVGATPNAVVRIYAPILQRVQ